MWATKRPMEAEREKTMNLGELQAALNKALAEGASKTDQIYLNVEGRVTGEYYRSPVTFSGEAHEVDQHITGRKCRSVVIKGRSYNVAT